MLPNLAPASQREVNLPDAASLTGEQLIVLRDLWQIVSRQIEAKLIGGNFTGTIELNCLQGRVKNYALRDIRNPEEEERRMADRRAAERDGDDRRMA